MSERLGAPASCGRRRADQRRGVEAGEHLTPGCASRVEIPVGQPADEFSIGRGRGQPLPVIPGEYVAQQDRHRPAVHHDVVVGQHQPVRCSAVRISATRKARLVGEIADRGAFVGAEPLDLLFAGITVGAEIQVPPGYFGIGRDDLHGLVELVDESGDQVWMPGGHRLHRIAQPVPVESTGDGQIQLHRIHFAARALAWKSSPCCSGVSGRMSAIRCCRCNSSSLVLVEPGRRHVGRRQPAATAADVRADTGQRVEPQPGQPRDRGAVECRGRPRPVGVQLRTGVAVHGAGIELQRVHQRHRHRGADAGDRRAFPADLPQLAGHLGPAAEPAQIVEPDRRIVYARP